MARPGYNQGMDDAYCGEPMRDNGDEEYYLAYQQFSRDDDPRRYEPEPQQPEPEYPLCCGCIYGDTSGQLLEGFRCALRHVAFLGLEDMPDECSAQIPLGLAERMDSDGIDE